MCPQCRLVVPAVKPAKAARRSQTTRKPRRSIAVKVDTVEVDQWKPVQVRVEGIPVTQGSMKVVRGRVMHVKGKELEAWRKLIADVLRDAGARPVGKQVAVRLDVVFWLVRPGSVPASKRPLPSAKSADLDKAIRAVGDAITGVIIEDDAQITTVVAQKRYADEGNPPGAWLRVTLDSDALTLAGES